MLSTGQGVLGNNSYTYCLNDPILMHDTLGSIPNVNVNMADSGKSDHAPKDNQYDIWRKMVV